MHCARPHSSAPRAAEVLENSLSVERKIEERVPAARLAAGRGGALGATCCPLVRNVIFGMLEMFSL